MADGACDFFVFVCGERDGGDEADCEPGPVVFVVFVKFVRWQEKEVKEREEGGGRDVTIL